MEAFTDNQEMNSAKCLAGQRRGLTKRAPDAGDSAAISNSFLRLVIFLVGRLRRPHPSAGNANRSPALRSGERDRGSGIRLSARRRANKRMEQTLRVVK